MGKSNMRNRNRAKAAAWALTPGIVAAATAGMMFTGQAYAADTDTFERTDIAVVVNVTEEAAGDFAATTASVAQPTESAASQAPRAPRTSAGAVVEITHVDHADGTGTVSSRRGAETATDTAEPADTAEPTDTEQAGTVAPTAPATAATDTTASSPAATADAAPSEKTAPVSTEAAAHVETETPPGRQQLASATSPAVRGAVNTSLSPVAAATPARTSPAVEAPQAVGHWHPRIKAMQAAAEANDEDAQPAVQTSHQQPADTVRGIQVAATTSPTALAASGEGLGLALIASGALLASGVRLSLRAAKNS